MLPLKLKYEYTTEDDLSFNFDSVNYGVNISGSNENQVKVDINADVLYEDWKDDDLTKIVSCKYLKEENVLKISTNETFEVKNIKIDVLVPFKTTTFINTNNGPVTVERLHSNIKIENENGPLNLKHIKGDMQLHSENGSIDIINCKSDIELKIENGPIKVKNYKGNFKLSSQNSPIKFSKCSGNLFLMTENGPVRILKAEFDKADIKSSNGSIYYEYAEIEEGRFDFKNENGKIHLIIPDELQYQIEAVNRRGKFHIGLGEDFEGIKGVNNNSDAEKTVNIGRGAGSVEINIENQRGSISLMKSGIKESKFKFDFSFVGDILDKTVSRTLQNLPEEIDKEKIRLKIDKAKDKLEKIPNIEIDIEDMIKEAKDEVQNVLKDFNGDDIKSKAEKTINKGLTKVMNTYQEKFRDEDLTETEKNQLDERSRLKILQMLEHGKITADEAEKLINTLEEK